MNNLINFLIEAEKVGINLENVFDIGACQGQWSFTIKKNALPKSKFFLFEANPAYADALIKTGFPHSCGVALSNSGRATVEFFNGTNTGDSYYKETTKYYDNQSTIELPCTTLDQIVAAGVPIPNFIKIDTQGSELDILSGASFLDRVDMIYTECPIICYNKGAPNIQDYIDFFKNRNFVPVDILEIHRSEGILIQIDIMFVRHDIKEKFIGPTQFIRPFA
jgi:FkbM family methyltransferase